MTRGYGWGPGGDRVVEATAQGHWNTTTMLAAIRVDGVIPQACLTFRGATDGLLFLTYIQRMLAPVLHPGDIVVMASS